MAGPQLEKGFTRIAHERRAIAAGLRFSVLSRDGFACVYCGAAATMTVLHVDHISPVAEGGTNAPDNLATACEACNLGKGWALLTPEEQARVRARSVISRAPPEDSARRPRAGSRVHRLEDAARCFVCRMAGQRLADEAHAQGGAPRDAISPPSIEDRGHEPWPTLPWADGHTVYVRDVGRFFSVPGYCFACSEIVDDHFTQDLFQRHNEIAHHSVEEWESAKIAYEARASVVPTL